jgi:PleD family two-component response regulator
VGVTEVLADDRDVLDLFNRMDTAMYDAKGKGRNTVADR